MTLFPEEAVGRATPAGGHAVDNDGARLRDLAVEGLSSSEMVSRAAVIGNERTRQLKR